MKRLLNLILSLKQTLYSLNMMIDHKRYFILLPQTCLVTRRCAAKSVFYMEDGKWTETVNMKKGVLDGKETGQAD